MIPDFDDGVLPRGVYPARWAELSLRFGGTPRREALLTGLSSALLDLKAAGCRRAYVDGSFVTAKSVPADFDLCWDLDGVEIGLVDPIILDVAPPRVAQKVKYGGDILPNVVEGRSGKPILEFFQIDKETGAPKGIIVLDLAELAR